MSRVRAITKDELHWQYCLGAPEIVDLHVDNQDRPHRLDGPAVVRAGGQREWWRHGKKHRADGPAVYFLTNKRDLRLVNLALRMSGRSDGNLKFLDQYWSYGYERSSLEIWLKYVTKNDDKRNLILFRMKMFPEEIYI